MSDPALASDTSAQIQGILRSGMVFWPLAAVSLAIIWRLGWLKPKVLPDAGQRSRVGLLPRDLAIGLILVLLGMLLMSGLLGMGQALERSHGQPLLSAGWKIALMTLLGQSLTFFPAVIYFVVRCSLEPGGWRRAGLEPDHIALNVARGLLALLLVFPLVIGISSFCIWLGTRFGQPVPDSGHALLKAMLDTPSRLATGVMILSAVVGAPILEELFFRGLVHSVLGNLGWFRCRRWSLVIFSSFFFALVHYDAVPWQGLAALACLGMALGWLYERYGTLMPSILLHMGFNALNILLTFVGMMDQAR